MKVTLAGEKAVPTQMPKPGTVRVAVAIRRFAVWGSRRQRKLESGDNGKSFDRSTKWRRVIPRSQGASASLHLRSHGLERT